MYKVTKVHWIFLPSTACHHTWQQPPPPRQVPHPFWWPTSLSQNPLMAHWSAFRWLIYSSFLSLPQSSQGSPCFPMAVLTLRQLPSLSDGPPLWVVEAVEGISVIEASNMENCWAGWKGWDLGPLIWMEIMKVSKARMQKDLKCHENCEMGLPKPGFESSKLRTFLRTNWKILTKKQG